MMKSYRLNILKLSVLFFLIIVSGSFFTGCSAKSNPVQYYVLSSSFEVMIKGQEVPVEKRVLIGLGPIQIPDFLNQSYIVTRKNETQLEMSEYHRWAGLFEKNIKAVIIEDISKMVENSLIVAWPTVHNIEPDYRISIDIIRFDGDLNQSVSLLATANIIDKQNKTTLFPVNVSVPVKGNSYDAYSIALSESLYNASQKIVSELKNVMLNPVEIEQVEIEQVEINPAESNPSETKLAKTKESL